MQFFSESCERLDARDVPGHVLAAVAELREADYDVEIVSPPEHFVLKGPLMRLRLDVALPSRPRHNVLRTEYVLLGEWDSYPASPPSVRFDRIDFPRAPWVGRS